jgi:hypothetical protein
LDFWNGRGDARVVAPFELAQLAGPGRGDAERGIR